MNDELFHALSEAELEAVEVADLWAANDEIFDADDFLDESEWRGDAEPEN